jgi:GTP pyrophosphokinase
MKHEVPLFENLLRELPPNLPPEDIELIRRAYEMAREAHADTERASGAAYLVHPLSVAIILAQLHLDTEAIAAALLHDVPEDTAFTSEDVREGFGPRIASLVEGVTKLGKIGQSTVQSGDLQRAESLRKLVLATADDVRVVLIKLADRLHNMRTLEPLPQKKRQRIAQETMDIYAPLANRLGIWQIKWELEDLAFLYLRPDVYDDLRRLLDTRRDERERYVQTIISVLEAELAKQGIKAEVSGRPKHIYSIWRKMQRKGIGFDQIYDVHGVRVVVSGVRDCYGALGAVHTLWSPIPGEFDDYIAMPKDNMYRSLHTAVVGTDGRPLEVQIRTSDMHQTAEYGIAAHWRYKEPGVRRDGVFEDKIAWLRRILDWREDVTDAYEFVDSLKTDVFQDRVYVFTPKGDIIDLPAGSTPIDFAYHVHTEVGNRCRGARVNGKLVSLNYQLVNGDQVEVITTKRGGPSRDWLNPNLNYVKTSRARSKIRRWFRQQDVEQNIATGRQVVEKELRRLNISLAYEELAKLFEFEKVDDFLAAAGYGGVNSRQLANKVLELERERQAEQLPTAVDLPKKRAPVLPVDGMMVKGTGQLLTTLGRCCNPLPGESIIGYITRGRGITVHRADCPNILASPEPERLIEVDWGEKSPIYPVMISVRAYDRPGLLRDITTLVADERVNLAQAAATVNPNDNTSLITATLEVSSSTQLARLLTKIEGLPNVLEAHRELA